MNRRSIVFLLVLAALLGLFFQLTRSSSFWQAASFRNAAHQRMTAQEPWSEAADIARDHFVILYDPTEVPSMFTRHNAETMLQEQKKVSRAIRSRKPSQSPPVRRPSCSPRDAWRAWPPSRLSSTTCARAARCSCSSIRA